MGYGLIDIGAQTRNQAMGGLREAARLEQQRENMNKELKAQQ
ncbi:MAG TPA: bacteriocin, partial [Plesiomonas shigelloides]|nr:bacteriocin [Plesiomonas shigelloides]